MKEIIWVTALAVGGLYGQTGQSPASVRPPQTVTPQTYPIEQIRAGEGQFSSECGFCHGRDAAGGETGPDLTRSSVVAQDSRGDKIGPVVRAGRVQRGMPSFDLNQTEIAAIAAFLHSQKDKFDALGGGRRSVDVSDLATGDAAAGRRYFEGEGGCSSCHSASKDLRGIDKRYEGLALLERMLYPNGRPAPTPPKVTITLASGRRITAPLAGEDEFTVTTMDSKKVKKTYQKSEVKFVVRDPMSAHFEQLAKYTDRDMHDVFAYLATLK